MGIIGVFSGAGTAIGGLLILVCCARGFGQEEQLHIMPNKKFFLQTPIPAEQERISESYANDAWVAIGPNGITSNAIVVAANNPNLIFAGGLSGLYKTTDGGIHWGLASEQLLNQYVSDLVIHPSNVNILLAWVQNNFGSFEDRLMRSTDGGVSWVTGLVRFSNVVGVQYDPLNPDRLFASADSIYRSSDGGITWKGVSPFAEVRALAIYRQNPEVLYALSGGRTVYSSSDGGQTWTVRSTFSLPFRGLEFALAVSPVDHNILFLGNSFFTGTGGFYRSVDAGITWVQSTSGFGQSKSIIAIGVDPVNPNVLYAGGLANGLYRSTNSGDTWTLASEIVPDRYLEDLLVSPEGKIYCAFGGGVYSSADQGTSWQSLNGDLQNVDVFGVVLHPTNTNVIYANSLGGVYRSLDGGASWQPANNGMIDTDVFGLAMDPNNTNVLYAGTFGGLVYKTTDGGVTWLEKSNGLVGLGEMLGSTFSISVHPKNSAWVWTGRSRTYQTFNGGESWAPFVIENRRAEIVICDPARPDTMYATARDTLFRTTDRGLTWAVQRTALRLGVLAVDPNMPNVLYADSLIGRAILKSTNGGLTWSRLEATPYATRGITINPANSAVIYAATFGNGVRRSIDGGLSWHNYNAGQPYLSAFSVTTSLTTPHRLFVATFGGSVYRVDETVTSVAEEAPVATEFALQQNYPNPFNPLTTIEFSLPRAEEVTLKVFNLSGVEVATLLSKRFEAGRHKTEWDASRLASGVYFYRLQAGEQVMMNKSLLLR